MKLFFNALSIYIGMIVLGIVAYLMQEYGYIKHIWDIWGVIDTSSAVALALLAAVAYYEYIKGDDVIKIYFQTGNKKIDTKLSLLRKEFSRSELLGLLGMVQKDQKERYKLAYFQNPEILKEIQKIQKGDGKEFIIKIEDDEKENFNITDTSI